MISDIETCIRTGMSLMGQNKREEAEICFNQALEIQPDLPVAKFHLGQIARARNNLSEAADCFRSVLRSDPDNIAAHVNLAMVLLGVEQLEEARQSYERIIELLPGISGEVFDTSQVAMLYFNLGKILRCQGMPREAIPYFQKALAAKPDFAQAGTSLLHVLHYAPGVDPDEIFRVHRQWARIQAETVQWERPMHAESGSQPRLRIGYVSPDFHQHSVAYFFEPLLQHHNRESYEIFCYSNVEASDQITERIRGQSEHWRDIRGMNVEAVAAMISGDRIDILVDLAGHTGDNSLHVFARRPAPVQMTYLGYPDTTGLAAMDFRITDAWADPPGDADTRHSETLLRLQRPFLCYKPPEILPSVLSLPLQSAGHITFGSFNNLAKVNTGVVDVWARILQQVPDSCLILKSFYLADPGTRERCLKQFVRLGIEPERIQMIGPVADIGGHLEYYSQIDIALDTFPYNGATTTFEAFLMGVPVITLAGVIHAGRVGVSILTELGMQELIANSEDEYVDIAAKLAGDTERMKVLRGSLRDRLIQSRLCDGRNMARSVESAFHEGWKAINQERAERG